MATISRRSSEVAEIKARSLTCDLYTRSNGFAAQQTDVDQAWRTLNGSPGAQLTCDDDGVYTIRLHNDCWYVLTPRSEDPMPATPPPARTTCPLCQKRTVLRKSGHMAKHQSGADPASVHPPECIGGGLTLEDARAIATDGESTATPVPDEEPVAASPDEEPVVASAPGRLVRLIGEAPWVDVEDLSELSEQDLLDRISGIDETLAAHGMSKDLTDMRTECTVELERRANLAQIEAGITAVAAALGAVPVPQRLVCSCCTDKACECVGRSLDGGRNSEEPIGWLDGAQQPLTCRCCKNSACDCEGNRVDLYVDVPPVTDDPAGEVAIAKANVKTKPVKPVRRNRGTRRHLNLKKMEDLLSLKDGVASATGEELEVWLPAAEARLAAAKGTSAASLVIQQRLRDLITEMRSQQARLTLASQNG